MTAAQGALDIRLRPRRLGEFPVGFVLSLVLLALPFGGWLVESGLLTLARCSFKVLFGIPCMGCGATRATLNVLHGDWFEALYFQPLAISVYSALTLWGVASVGLYVVGKQVDVEMARWLTWTIRITLIALPFLNWFYLVAREI